VTPAEQNWQVLLAHLEAEKRCDFDGTLECLAEDCVFDSGDLKRQLGL